MRSCSARVRSDWTAYSFFPPTFIEQVLHELIDVAVGDERSTLGGAIGRGETDEETALDGLDVDAAHRIVDGRWRLTGIEIGEERLLEEFYLGGRQRLDDFAAELGADEDLEVGVELDVAIDGDVHDLL
ncbi:MAG: hypothetical protein QM760_08905 [Nibricoccus sp.]